MEHVDLRASRFDAGVLALALVVGFTYRVEWVIPIAAIVTALGAAGGPNFAPLVGLYWTFVPVRADGPPVTEWRFGVMLEGAALALATTIVFTGLEPIGWLFALVVAGAMALEAATGLSAGRRLYRSRT